MKRLLLFVLALVLCVVSGVFTSCGEKKKSVTIYSSAEDYRNAAAREMLVKQFPEYEINLIEMDTGSLAALVAASGKDVEADIILEMEATYMAKVSDSLATLTDVDFDKYAQNLVPENHKYVPWTLMSGAIIIDEKALADKGVAVPTCYDDLLKPEYKGLVSMPNPKSSGTGYIFYLNMVNTRGEAAALAYFDKLAQNISGAGFTTSGSGPVKALVTGEAAIALGMTFQGANSISEGNDFKIMFFEEGAPYTVYSSAVIAGRETDADVMKVFDYIVSDVTPNDKRLYAPEPIYKEWEITMENFPRDIVYGDMTGIDDIARKEYLLDKWNH